MKPGTSVKIDNSAPKKEESTECEYRVPSNHESAELPEGVLGYEIDQETILKFLLFGDFWPRSVLDSRSVLSTRHSALGQALTNGRVARPTGSRPDGRE